MVPKQVALRCRKTGQQLPLITPLLHNPVLHLHPTSHCNSLLSHLLTLLLSTHPLPPLLLTATARPSPGGA
jgi:hypothetical protein